MRRFLVLAAIVGLLWLTARPSSHVHPPFVGDHSVTVILPVIPNTLASLDDLLAPFLVPTHILYEVALVCPYALVADIRRALPVVLSNATLGHPKVTLYPWSGPVHHHQASLQLIARVKTHYTLLLDEHGFKHISECDRAYLVHPRAMDLPAGPHGFARSLHSWSQISPSDYAQPVAFLVPPFIVPSGLLANLQITSPSLDWRVLGNIIAKSTLGSFGGIVIGTDLLDAPACHLKAESTISFSDGELTGLGSMPISLTGFFVLAFPRIEDLMDFTPAACRLCQRGHTVMAYIYDHEVSNLAIQCNCTMHHIEHARKAHGFSDWLDSLGSVPDIVIGLDHPDPVSSTFSLILERAPFLNTTLLRLPRIQLPYTDWIGTLTLHQLRHWNVPEITLCVITNDRPRSLLRLLNSIQHTLFYGDKVNIRINMDLTSNPETLHVVQDFEWLHGDVFLHHRVIHGSLLPAVVESWYPHGNDSYGLLLEDDIELSPLSYAWVKMTLLRYKYGASGASSSRLFGISLYQQKIVELRPTGRRPFSARMLFQSASLADPSTPYLSQVPCSWGALYFPSHWREFHDYLSLRLSELALPVHTTVVPGVRSNKWTKSWKKYFIELVYLRGYVMLYPNYADYVSLSTNHLEVGSHVKDEPEAVYARKKHLYSLPLMPLSGASAVAGTNPRLLDLPDGVLPDWERLPVLDLVGELSSLEAIQKRGDARRAELGNCMGVASLPPRVRDFL